MMIPCECGKWKKIYPAAHIFNGPGGSTCVNSVERALKKALQHQSIVSARAISSAMSVILRGISSPLFPGSGAVDTAIGAVYIAEVVGGHRR
jgi:hypothetical protein